jgi:hypothetical protein
MTAALAHCHQCFRIHVFPLPYDVTGSASLALAVDGVMLTFIAPLILWIGSSWWPGKWRRH